MFNSSRLKNSLMRSGALRLVKSRVDDALYSAINLFSKNCSVKNKELITHFAHHKCGTTWLNNSLYNISKRYGLKYQKCVQEELKEDTDIWLQEHSKVIFENLPAYVGSHMIRDPRDITISAYFYHLWCHEEWCHIKKEEYGGMSYQ